MATRDANYTKTGNGWLTSLANKLSFVPLLGFISAPLIMLDSGISAIGWALRGKFVSAATTLGTGAVSAGVASLNNPVNMPIYWAANLVSGITTGRSIQTHARALTEGAASMVTKPLGVQPVVLSSHYAGVGGIGGVATSPIQSTPGYWANKVTPAGVDPQARYDQYRNGDGGQHLADLEASRAQGAAAGRA